MVLEKLKVATVLGALIAVAVGSIGLVPNAGVDANAAPARKSVKDVPEGPNKILFSRDGNLVLFGPDGKNVKQLTEDRETLYREARLSPDGKKIAALVKSMKGVAQQLKLYVRAFDEKELGTDLGVECKTFVWSTDGSEIACCDFDEEASEKKRVYKHFVINVKTKEKRTLNLPAHQILTDWSRDGKFFLTTSVRADKEKPQVRLHLMNRDGTEHKVLTDENQFSALGLLSSDGKRVLYRLEPVPKDGKRRPKRELAVLDIETGVSVVVGETPSKGEIQGYCWSADGKQIAYAWLQIQDGKPEAQDIVVVCDPDGKNAKTIVTEKGSRAFNLPIGRVDWR